MFESLFNKVASLRPASLLKGDSNTVIFPVNFAKVLRAPILKNIYEHLRTFEVANIY